MTCWDLMGKSSGQGYPISEKLEGEERATGKGRQLLLRQALSPHTVAGGSKVHALRTHLPTLLQARRTSQQVSGSGGPKEWDLLRSQRSWVSAVLSQNMRDRSSEKAKDA